MHRTKSTLTLLAAPARPRGPAYALVPLRGIAPLASAWRAPRATENLCLGRELCESAARVLESAHLPQWVAARGLPPADPYRLCYPAIARLCLQLADLVTRVDALLREQHFTQLNYVGPAGWRCQALAALCEARGVDYRQHVRTHWRRRAEELLRQRRDAFYRRRDQRHNASITRAPASGTPATTLFLGGNTRMTMGLTPAIALLTGVTKTVETATGATAQLMPAAARDDIWRLNGDLPLPGQRHGGEAALRSALTHTAATNHFAIQLFGVVLGPALFALLAEGLSGAMAQIEALAALLEANPAARVVATLEHEALLEVPRAAGREVVVAQVCGRSEYTRLLPGSGHYLAISNADAEGFAELGVARENITVCGHAYYDAQEPAATAAAAAALRARLGIASGRRFFLLVDNNVVPGLVEQETREDSLSAIYSGLAGAVAESDGVIVVKQRPGGSKRARDAEHRLHTRLARRAGIDEAALVVCGESLIMPFIAACDLMVMFNSTAGIEAIALDKPLINVPDVGIDWFGYTATGAAREAHSATEIDAAVRALLYDEAARESLAQGRACFRQCYLHAQDGAVAARMAAAIERGPVADPLNSTAVGSAG
jgi:hypothetical protein